MATVYLAEDLNTDARLPSKSCGPELAADRLVREIRTIAALQHPHILGLIDSGYEAPGHLHRHKAGGDIKLHRL